MIISKYRLISRWVLATGTFLWACACGAQLSQVRTAYGTVAGYQEGGLSIFKGIPYAQPPVGPLRWQAPRPPRSWSGVRRCLNFSASPMQAKPVPFMMWTREFIAPPEPLSEDCLYLNIWTPARKSTERLPVLVWIYGGGFVSGSAACAIYDGASLARQGVVFVSLNYRVGAFGFLALKELDRESRQGTSGNYGLLDQIAALKWIRRNIAAFGGDPDRVTIAGQSAGSVSVNALVATPLAKGLFQRAIAESGFLISGSLVRPLADGERAGEEFLKKAGVHDLAGLRALSAEQLQQAASAMPFGTFGLVADQYVLPTAPNAWFREGKHNDVPILAGWVTGDASILGNQPVTAGTLHQLAARTFGPDSSAFLDVFGARTDSEARASMARLSLVQFATLSCHLWAGYNQHKAFLYQYSFVPADLPGFPNYGAFHTSEVPYALHNLHTWQRPWQPRDYRMESMLSRYWVNFVRTGDPNGPGLPRWEPYDPQQQAVQELGDTILSRSGLYRRENTFLSAHLPSR
ncbi:MAG TPA: carboxylesterase family protein [Chitinophagaceae bacterium]|nr:carboxylesterase family protein [Chitinophagaceae bacterium]